MSRCRGLLEELSADHLHRISDVCYRLVKDHCIILAPPLSAATSLRSRATLLPNRREAGIAERLNAGERTPS